MKVSVLSLFDGISGGRVALERAGIEVDKYYASEIDKYAIQVAMKNYPDTVQIGDVTKVDGKQFEGIDLLIGGSPCQDLSAAKKNGDGLNGEKSGLFFEFVRVLQESKPRFFLLENVASMKKENRDIISSYLGVKPMAINSHLVSALERNRLYWTNIPDIAAMANKGIMFREIMEPNPEGRYYFTEKSYACMEAIRERSERKGLGFRSAPMKPPHSEKFKNLDANYHKGIDGKRTMIQMPDGRIRMATPIEAERLQTLPDNYTAGISNTQRYKCLGNGWTVEVIAHLLRGIAEHGKVGE